MEQQFEKASRKKIRFESAKGNLTVEDLWDVPLSAARGGICLDDIAKGLNKKLKESNTESFVLKNKRDTSCTQLKFDIVLHVINTRLAEEEKAEQFKVNKEKKQRILELIARKEEEVDGQKSIDQLKEELSKLADTM